MPARGISRAATACKTAYIVKVGDTFATRTAESMVLSRIDSIGDVRLSDMADVEITDNADDSYAKVGQEPRGTAVPLHKVHRRPPQTISYASNAAMRL